MERGGSLITKRDGERTGEIVEGLYQVLVAAWEEFPSEVTVTVYQLVKGQVEETMIGPMYRTALGKILHEEDFLVDWDVHTLALQANRSVRSDEIHTLPQRLQVYAWAALMQVTPPE